MLDVKGLDYRPMRRQPADRAGPELPATRHVHFHLDGSSPATGTAESGRLAQTDLRPANAAGSILATGHPRGRAQTWKTGEVLLLNGKC